MQNQDPHRIALLRDLLMDYPYEKTPNHGEPPAGLTPDEEDQWVEDYMQRNGPDLPLEGRYGGDMGRTEASMVPYSQQAADDVDATGWYTNFNMPKAGKVAPVPDDPEQMPTRVQALAQKLAPSQEGVFTDWFEGLPWAKEFEQRYGEKPNPNDSQYDYRKAFQAGVTPERYEPDGGAYHWPSSTPDGQSLKGPNHPTLWAEQFMQQTGTDPFTIGIEDPMSASLYLRGNRPQGGGR